MKKIFISLFSIITLSHATAIAAPFQPPIKTFIEYCQQKSTLPEATKHTVEVLLKKAGTQDCQQANRKLKSLTWFNLTANPIKNKTCPIKPKSICGF
ncbi:MAG: hypothetical protein KI793_14330 [Rivularia sp. (in: Bacteria)]|nr:hypothetical protein [Rivularia sp. MS3]